MITSLDDLVELKNLSALHIRDNKLEKLDGFGEKMQALQYINLRYLSAQFLANTRCYMLNFLFNIISKRKFSY